MSVVADKVPRQQWSPASSGYASIFGGQATNRAYVLAAGNSVTEGVAASDSASTWVRVLQDRIRQRFGTIDDAVGYEAAWWSALTGFAGPATTGTAVGVATGIGRRALGLLDVGDTATFTVDGHTARVWHPTLSGGGSMYVDVDSEGAPSTGYLAGLDGTTGRYAVAGGCPNCNTATTTLTLVFWASADDWTPGVTKSLGGWQNIVRAELTSAGRLSMTINDGAGHTANTVNPVGWTDGTGRWMKLECNLTADTVTFSHSTNAYTTALASISWTTIDAGIALASATGAPSSITTAIAGALATTTGGTQAWDGVMRRAAGYIDGTLAWHMDPVAVPAPATFFGGPTGELWYCTAGVMVGQDTPKRSWLDGDAPTSMTYSDVDLGGAGTHDVEIGYQSQGVTFLPIVSAVEACDGSGPTAGVAIMNGGRAGYSVADYLASVGTDLFSSLIDVMSPRLLILEFGLNERVAQTDPSTYAANLESMIDAAQAANPTMPIILFAAWTPENNAGPTYFWSDYVDAMHSVAAGYAGVTVVDFSTGWPQPGTIAGDASGYYADTVHPSDAGHAAIADRFANMLDPYRPYRARRAA